MKWLVDLFVQIRASSLGQDATIEIMIALLGVMVCVLALIVTLLSIVLAVLGFLGYRDIKKAAVKAAKEAADKTAKQVAKKVAAKARKVGLEITQATEMVEGQAIEVKEKSPSEVTQTTQPQEPRAKATTDEGLR